MAWEATSLGRYTDIDQHHPLPNKKIYNILNNALFVYVELIDELLEEVKALDLCHEKTIVTNDLLDNLKMLQDIIKNLSKACENHACICKRMILLNENQKLIALRDYATVFSTEVTELDKNLEVTFTEVKVVFLG